MKIRIWLNIIVGFWDMVMVLFSALNGKIINLLVFGILGIGLFYLSYLQIKDQELNERKSK